MRVYKNKRYCSFQQHNNQPKTNNYQTTTTYCDFNYLLQLQLPTATSTAYCNFNHLLQLQLPTATSTTYCNFNYLLQLQLPTATSTTYCNFNYLLQLQLPTATTHIYCNYYNPLVQLSSSAELQLLNTRVEAQRQIRCNEVTSRLFRCHRVVPRLRSNFTKVSQRIE